MIPPRVAAVLDGAQCGGQKCNLSAFLGVNYDFSKKCIDKPLRPCYNNTVDFGVWHSLVVRMVRVHEVAGSNPVTPTKPY